MVKVINIYITNGSLLAPVIATEWQGATSGVVSGLERTRSPTANNADEKSTAGAGRVAAAENKN